VVFLDGSLAFSSLFDPAHLRRWRCGFATRTTEARVLAVDMSTRPGAPLWHRFARLRDERHIGASRTRLWRGRNGRAERAHVPGGCLRWRGPIAGLRRERRGRDLLSRLTRWTPILLRWRIRCLSWIARRLRQARSRHLPYASTGNTWRSNCGWFAPT